MPRPLPKVKHYKDFLAEAETRSKPKLKALMDKAKKDRKERRKKGVKISLPKQSWMSPL